MTESTHRVAWIELPTTEEFQALTPPGKRGPYEFGFVPAMSRLVRAHDRIGPLFARLYAQVMFGEGCLDRREREMVAAVAAAAQDCHY